MHRNDEFTDPNGERSVNDQDVGSMGRPFVCGLDPALGFLHLWEKMCTFDRFLRCFDLESMFFFFLTSIEVEAEPLPLSRLS